MSSHIFLDTNLLVYAYEKLATPKHLKCKVLLDGFWQRSDKPWLSVQVLQEFYVTLLKCKYPKDSAKRLVGDFLDDWPVIENSKEVLRRALEGKERY